MTSATKPPAACLIGWPAAHSRSPLIHHYWLRTLGIEGGYVIEAVPPDELQGFRVPAVAAAASSAPTSPFRTRSGRFRCRSRTRAPARSARPIRCGSRMASCCSTNTDVEGFINNLDACADGWDTVRGRAGARRRRLVARGAVRTARTRHQARASRQPHHGARPGAGGSVRRERCPPVAWDAIGDLLPRAGLLVNTTSLGMKGQPPLELDVGRLPSHAVVADLVYVPLDTPLLAAATRARAEDRRRARHAAAPGGARASNCGSAGAPR